VSKGCAYYLPIEPRLQHLLLLLLLTEVLLQRKERARGAIRQTDGGHGDILVGAAAATAVPAVAAAAIAAATSAVHRIHER
jgi:hypothetical protein